MAMTPEHAFDLFFTDLNDPSYRGRATLASLRVRALPADLLRNIQQTMNEALALGEHAESGQGNKHRFHFDYIDSDDENALAFTNHGYSFIGITIPLTTLLWDTCKWLSASERVVRALGLEGRDVDAEMLQVVLFRFALNFVITHEWAHHKRGHLSRQSSAARWVDEGNPTSSDGGMTTQSLEGDADGYAAYFVLAHHLVSDEGRTHATELLNLGDLSAAAQDAILFDCFVAASTAFFFWLPSPHLDSATVTGWSHPPQIFRVHLLILHAVKWSQSCASLSQSMTSSRFRELTTAVKDAIWEPQRHGEWTTQVAFFRSAEGSAYLNELILLLDALKAAE